MKADTATGFEQAVRDAEAARARAIIARDWVALEALLDKELLYIHAPGLVHDRAQWLDYLRSGPTFQAIDLDLQRLRIEGHVALAYGTLGLRFRRGDAPAIEARSFVTQTWVKRPDGWKLAVFQSTRLPDPAP